MINSSPYNDMKILYHTEKIESLINLKRTSPVYVRVKPTNVCNQKCNYCAYASDKVVDGRKASNRDYIPFIKMKEIIDDLKSMGVKAITFSGGGDPLCYPYIKEALSLVNSYNIDYSIITNGQDLDKVYHELVNAKWVRISLDSANKETYKKLRSVETFNKVINNISEFAKIKKAGCELGINYVVTKENHNQIFEFCLLADSINVNNVKFAPLVVKNDMIEYHKEICEEAIKQLNEAKEYLKKSKLKIIDKYQDDSNFNPILERACSKCYISNFFTVIAADCKVYYCHQKSYQENGEIGDISSKSFKELWYDDEIISKMNLFNPKMNCKNICVFDERNKLLESIVNIDRNHVNFI